MASGKWLCILVNVNCKEDEDWVGGKIEGSGR